MSCILNIDYIFQNDSYIVYPLHLYIDIVYQLSVIIYIYIIINFAWIMCKCICMVELVDLHVIIARIMINIVIMVSLIQFISHTCRPINIVVIIILILATIVY